MKITNIVSGIDSSMDTLRKCKEALISDDIGSYKEIETLKQENMILKMSTDPLYIASIENLRADIEEWKNRYKASQDHMIKMREDAHGFMNEKFKLKEENEILRAANCPLYAASMDDLRREVEQLKEENKILKDCAEFYSLSDNWIDNDLFGHPPSIVMSDMQSGNEFGESKHLTVGGKLARETLSKIGEK